MSYLIPGQIFSGSPVALPDAILPVITVPRPLGPNMPGVGFAFREHDNSATFSIAINQGPATGPTFGWICDLPQGIWRLSGQLVSNTLVGPAPSSASMDAARIALYSPGGLSACALCSTGLFLSEPQYAYFSVTLNVNIVNPSQLWTLYVETMVASAAGQSMGVRGNVYAERLG